MPLYLSRSLDPNIVARVETSIDKADEALQQFDAKRNEAASKKGASSKDYGLTRSVVLEYADGTPVPLGGVFRKRLYQHGYLETPEGLEVDYDPEWDDLDIDRRRPSGGYDPADYA